MIKKFLLPALFGLSLNSPATAQQFLTKENITLLGRTAEILCASYQISGSSSDLTIDADAEAEVRALLRVLRGKLDIDIDAITNKYINVPHSDLAEELQSQRACKLEVFKDLRKDFSEAQIGSSPQTGSLLWNFPHAIKEGVALGVISVRRKGGSGVNINFRARNLLEIPVYVYFDLPSYTDNTGTVCQDGSFSTSVVGVARSSPPPTEILPGESIQFAAKNVRCDANNFGTSGDIIQRAYVGTSSDNQKLISFEIAAIDMLEN